MPRAQGLECGCLEDRKHYFDEVMSPLQQWMPLCNRAVDFIFPKDKNVCLGLLLRP